ncbi:MAG: response regulator [Chloroflexi bacterium]|nr:response regulator [Chloroflexota bacterium]
MTEQSQQPKKRVLVVDDEQRILKFIGLMLKVSGYEVIIATNGMEGLQMAQTQKPDIILLDIIMPVMDGFEMLRRLRSFCNIPVIVFSARGQTSEKALSLGANDYIAKPFKPEELTERIANILGK